eukprot:Nk52_evm28s294 gene=Nk52_evmTU28s294
MAASSSPFKGNSPLGSPRGSRASSSELKVGDEVDVHGRRGIIRYTGPTLFASGKWIGIALFEAEGKNNGTVQGKAYFECEEMHGIFVRQSQVTLVGSGSGRREETGAETAASPKQKRAALPGSPAGRVSGRQAGGGDTSSATRGSPLTGAASSGGETPTPRKIGGAGSAGMVTPGKTASASVSGTPAKEVDVAVRAELEELRKNFVSLQSQNEVLQVKREQDKLKLVELDKLKAQLEHIQEYKAKWVESQRDLQGQLREAKSAAKEAMEGLEPLQTENNDLQEMLEMATLDKEMAEEKVEVLTIELNALKEKNEELQLDFEILKGELEEGGEGSASSAEVKQLTQQNERLKEALVRLRDLSGSEKQELNQKLKTLEKELLAVDELKKENEKLLAKLKDSELEVDELKVQVDEHSMAAEMVERLTDQNLNYEQKVDELEEEVRDLEVLKDLNEELEENHIATERQLQEELDFANMNMQEQMRKNDALNEAIVDLSQTILKFRELVASLQEENESMKSGSGIDVSKTGRKSNPDVLEMPSSTSEMKVSHQTHVGKIDTELRKLETTELCKKISLVESFFPDGFLSKQVGVVDTVLFVYKLLKKTELLISETSSIYGIEGDVLSKRTFATTDSFISHMEKSLVALKVVDICHSLQSSLSLLKYVIERGDLGIFRTLSGSLSDLIACDAKVSEFLVILKTNELNMSTELSFLKECEIKLGGIRASVEEKLGSQILFSLADCMESGLSSLSHFSSFVVICVRRVLTVLQPDTIESMEASSTEKQQIESFVGCIDSLRTASLSMRSSCKKALKKFSSMASDGGNGLVMSFSFPEMYLSKFEKCFDVYKTLCGAMMELSKGFLEMGEARLKEGSPGLNTADMCIAVYSFMMQFANSNKILMSYGSDWAQVSSQLKTSFSEVDSLMHDFIRGEFDAPDESRPVGVSKTGSVPFDELSKEVRNELADNNSLRDLVSAKNEEVAALTNAAKLTESKLTEKELKIDMQDRQIDKFTRQMEKLSLLERKAAKTAEQERVLNEAMDELQADLDLLQKENNSLKKQLKKGAGRIHSNPLPGGGSPARTMLGPGGSPFSNRGAESPTGSTFSLNESLDGSFENIGERSNIGVSSGRASGLLLALDCVRQRCNELQKEKAFRQISEWSSLTPVVDADENKSVMGAYKDTMKYADVLLASAANAKVISISKKDRSIPANPLEQIRRYNSRVMHIGRESSNACNRLREKVVNAKFGKQLLKKGYFASFLESRGQQSLPLLAPDEAKTSAIIRIPNIGISSSETVALDRENFKAVHAALVC